MNPPVFAHGHLRLYLLSLLAEQPMHGYDIIQALGRRFGGTYAPSAGTIYPRLSKLEEEGLVTKSTDGRKTVYAITDAGRAELATRGSELDDIENDVSDSVRRLADEVRASVNDAMRTLRADLAAAAREARDEPAREGRAFTVDDPAEGISARAENRVHLQQADAAITEFRSRLRGELRRHVVDGELGADTVHLLQRQLDGVRETVLASLER